MTLPYGIHQMNSEYYEFLGLVMCFLPSLRRLEVQMKSSEAQTVEIEGEEVLVTQWWLSLLDRMDFECLSHLRIVFKAQSFTATNNHRECTLEGSELEGFPNLRSLYLKGCCLPSQPPDELMDRLGNLTEVLIDSVLDIESVPLFCGARVLRLKKLIVDDVAELELLAYCPRLVVLDLEVTTTSRGDCPKRLDLSFMAKTTSLQTLNISLKHCMLRVHGGPHIETDPPVPCLQCYNLPELPALTAMAVDLLPGHPTMAYPRLREVRTTTTDWLPLLGPGSFEAVTRLVLDHRGKVDSLAFIANLPNLKALTVTAVHVDENAQPSTVPWSTSVTTLAFNVPYRVLLSRLPPEAPAPGSQPLWDHKGLGGLFPSVQELQLLFPLPAGSKAGLLGLPALKKLSWGHPTPVEDMATMKMMTSVTELKVTEEGRNRREVA